MKKSYKSFTIFCLGLILVVTVANRIFKKEKQNNSNNNLSIKEETPILIFDKKEYYSSWNDDSHNQFISIQRLLISNKITGCGEFYYNKIEPETFIIACTRDGVNFKYYVAWIQRNKIYSAESDMLTVNKSPK